MKELTQKMSFDRICSQIQRFILSPQKVFLMALIIAGISTLCTCIFLDDIFRDTANVYAVFARDLGNTGLQKWAAPQQVPLFNIMLAGFLTYLGMEAVCALSLIGGAFYLAVCFPLRKLLERYVSPLMAAWGCVLYVSAPKLIRYACAPLIDSASLFFLVCSVVYFLCLAEDPKIKNAVLFGTSAGFLAVSRGEGFVITAALLLGLPLFILLFVRVVPWKKQGVMWLIALCCTMAAVSPFCAVNYWKNGCFATDTRIVYYIKDLKKISNPPQEKSVKKKQLPANRSPRYKNLQERLIHMFSCLAGAGHELYWILTFIGAAVIIRKKEFKYDFLLLIGVNLLYCLIYLFTVSATRYYLFTVPFYMVFTLTGAEFMRQQFCRRSSRKLKCLAAGICALVLLLQTGNGLKRAFSSDGKDFKAAGAWIREYGKKHIPDRTLRLFAPSMPEVAYWSGAANTDGYAKKKHDPAHFRDFDLAVVHRKKPLGLDKRKDLERIKGTPHEKNIWIYKVKKAGAE